MEFSERLRALRKEKGLSQQRLGELLDLSTSAVKMYEKGERFPKIDTLEAIADIFNVDVEYLIGRQEKKKKSSIVVLDSETAEILEAIKTSPEMKALFSVSKDATADDIKKAMNIIEALKK